MASQPTTPTSVFQTRLFDETPGALSMTNYFWLNSYGQFRVKGGPFGVSGWYTLPGTRASYAAQHPTDSEIKDVNRVGFVNDSVTAADATGFDFGPYDTDNDGFVDCLVLIAQGMGQEGTGGPDAFWAHQGEITPRLTNDVNSQGEQVYVSRYFVVSELLQIPDNPATTTVDETAPTPQTIGVIAHEYGHALGLPDLYDRTGGRTTTSNGLGQWSLMGSGNWLGTGVIGSRPAWLDAWCRKKLGWATVQNITQNTLQLEIPSAQTSPVVYRLWTNGNLGQQYFLVENRPAVGFDEFLPGGGGGLLIYHVDDTMTASQNDNAWWYIGPGTGNSRTTSGHYQVALEQADGLFNLERLGTNSNRGDAGDPWTSTTSFNGSSVPSSRKYNTAGTAGEGAETFVEVRNISAPDTNRVIKADMIVSSNQFASTTITLPAPPVGDDIPVYQTMPQFEGTAFDDDAWGTGVWEVQVYLREDKPDGRYWKFTTHEWQSTYSEQQQKGVAVGTGGLNWARPMDDSALSDGVYEVKARSQDAVGLLGPFVAQKFRIQRDMSAPDATITTPGTSPLSAVPTMTGTATDNVAVQEKRFCLYSHTQGKWLKWTPAPGALDSGTFSPTDHILTQNNGGSPWSVTLPPLLPNGDYQFFVEAVDTTNHSSGWRHAYFTLQVAPKVALTGPLHGSYRNSAPVITGTAQPGAGATLVLNRVTLVIQRGSQWWDGNSWENTFAEVHANVSSGTWSYPATSSDVVAQTPDGDGGYTVTVSATDSLGRVSLPVLPGLSGNTEASFTVDTVPPVLEIASPLPDGVITGPPLLPSTLHGSTDDSSGRPLIKLLLKRLADGKYWSGLNWFADSGQALVPGHFDGDDLASQTAWEWSVRMPRLGNREGSMSNGGYELTAVAQDIAGNETTKTRAFTVNWNPVWMRPQDALAQIQPEQTPPIAGTVGSSVHLTYSPRSGPEDNSRTIAPSTFGLDAAGNSYVISRANAVLGVNFGGSNFAGIFQRLGAGGWRRERNVIDITSNPFDPEFTESWDGVSATPIPDEQGFAHCDFVHGAVDAAGNTYGVYVLRQGSPVLHVFATLVVKFSPSGTLLWRTVLDRGSAPQRILPAPDGGAWVVMQNAYLQSIEYGFSMIEVTKVSTAGSFGPIAVHGQLDGGDYDPAVWATQLLTEVDSSGNLFLATSENTIGGTDPIQVLRKHNAAGEELAKLEVDPGETPESWLTMKTDTAGNLYVASIFDVSETDRRICLTRYDSSLQLQWRAFGPANSIGYNWNTAWTPQMHVGPHGITLSYLSPGQGYYSEFPYEHGQFARFTSTGDLLWTRGIKGGTATVLHGDSIFGFQVDTAGNVLFLAAFNEPTSVSDFHYGKLTAAGDLQFIRDTDGLANFFPIDTTVLYQGTRLLALDRGFNHAPPPDDTYDLVLFDNPANQLVPVTLDADSPTDLLVLEGASTQLRVINRGSAATYQWRKKDGLGVPQNIPGATLDRLFLNNITPADAGEYSAVVTNAVDNATSRTATVTVLPPVALDVALDTPGRTWTTGGSKPWVGFASTTLAHDTMDAAMPTTLARGETAWLETTVTGPISVSYRWKSANPTFGDFYQFTIDGDPAGYINGDHDWTLVQHSLGAGTHTLRWSFNKSTEVTGGSVNTVFLDQVVITGSSSVPLADALDTTGLTWTTSAGDLAWTGVTSPSHDGVDSAASGTTGNNQQSFMETTVTGPGTLSFWWKVSSESGFDYLKLTVDGAPYGSASGEVDWTEIIRPISAGSHVIRWSYEKDSFFAGGQDRAWVDQVVFTPGSSPAPEIVVERDPNHSLTDSTGFVDFGAALPGNNTVRTFTIRNTGTAPLTGLFIIEDGANPPDFAFSALSSNSVNPGGTATFSVTFTPLSAGAQTAAIYIASNDADENTFDIELRGTGGIPITSWRQTHFGTTANTGAAADDADDDDDGVPNLLEFATTGTPGAPDEEPGELAPMDDSGLLYFTYTRNKQAMAEISYQVEWTDDLLLAWSTAGVVETIVHDNGLIQTVTATLPAGPGGRRFVRLRVTRAP